MKLSRGYIREFIARTARNNTLETPGAFIHGCIGNCGRTRLQCLKARKCELKDDARILNSLKQRYDSWQQTIKEGKAFLWHNEFNKEIF